MQHRTAHASASRLSVSDAFGAAPRECRLEAGLESPAACAYKRPRRYADRPGNRAKKLRRAGQSVDRSPVHPAGHRRPRDRPLDDLRDVDDDRLLTTNRPLSGTPASAQWSALETAVD